MSYLRSIWRKLSPLAAAVACWLAIYGTALAKEAEEGKKDGASWVPSYGLLLLGVVLGMLGICLSSRRRDREKPEVYDKTIKHANDA